MTENVQERLHELRRQSISSYERGHYREAIGIAIQATEVTRHNFGEAHPEYATSLNTLAALYQEMGDFSKAESLARRSLEISRVTVGERHPNYVRGLEYLAALYHVRREFRKAEGLYKEALRIRRDTSGAADPQYATTLNNLATLYYETREFAKAEPLYQQALDIRCTTLGKAHPACAESLNNLAGVHVAVGEIAKAEPLYREALEMSRALGERHPAYATVVTNLAALYKKTGKRSSADALLRGLPRPNPAIDRITRNVASVSRALESGAPLDAPHVVAHLRAAEAELREVSQIDPSSERVRKNLSDVRDLLTRMGDDSRQTTSALPSTIASRSKSSGKSANPVDCSVFGRPVADLGDQTLVQVFLHRPEQLKGAKELAKEFDRHAQRLGWHSLEVDVPAETRLQIHLALPGLVVDEPVQVVMWRGHPIAVQFGVEIPETHRIGSVIGKVTVYRDVVPIGHIKFKLAIKAFDAAATLPDAQPLGLQAHRYRMAFISYASKDRGEVLKRVQMLERFHVPYFQDLLSLEPGARWEQKLYEQIDACDVFLLFWSSHARESEWVAKEVDRALHRKGGDELAPPEIVPIIIEGPPAPPPPERLRHLHFDDRLVHLAG